MPIPYSKPDPICRYVKDTGAEWEYGTYDLNKVAHRKGTRATMEAAMKANHMSPMPCPAK
jgi:hypothetical protein